MNRLRLAGGTVVVADGVCRADVVIDAGRITAVAPCGDAGAQGERRLDVTGAVVAPGFVDLQVNGGYGIDLTSDPHRIVDLAAHLPRHGVTAFLPTIVTSPPSTRAAALEAIGAVERDGHRAGCARPLGLHFEGPMLATGRRGAHAELLLATPERAELATWRSDTGVALVTLAPELPGALEVVARLRRQGVIVSAGHTDADPQQFHAARLAGVGYVTHLFNAMRPFTHRDPGTVGAVLTDDEVVAGLICDGIHVDPVAVRLAWRALGAGRLTLVSDAVAALGRPTGTQRVGRIDVRVDETGVRTAGGVLAGSALALDAAVRNLVAFTGCTPAEAVRTVTSTPARVLGRRDVGTITPGAPADVVVLDERLAVRTTIIGGEVAWTS